ncbi:MAG TPA: TonB-dependent receptor [Blastocatellia bacterium]|nr:TonB-dependent receptor [Blastocatellia bacterium]
MKDSGFRKTVTAMAVLALLVMPLLGPVSAMAQTANTGVITGIVKDQSGAVVSDATIKAINKQTGIERSTTSSGSGSYELAQLPPGDYRVEVDAKGFGKYVTEPVTVNVLARVALDPEMKPAGSAEQVTVTAEGTALVETAKTDVGGVISQRQLESLPVNGRSFASLAVLIPGATLQPSFDPTKSRVGTFSVGGSTGRNLNITIDGGDNKDNAVGGILQNFSMEGIQEFALSTQRFSAANGRSGGALLSVIGKSGGNAIHGSAFGFFRDDALNANAPKLLASANPNLFDPGDAIKPPFDRQQFGGSIGGPIKKDKAFWFGAYERTRERGNSIVPTFAFDEIVFLEPLGYQAVKLLPQPFNDHQYQIKTDFHPKDNHSFTFRFAGQNNDGLNDQAGFLTVFTDLSGGNTTENDLYNLLGSWTWTATPRVVNQFLYQFSDFNNQIGATTDLKSIVTASGIAVGRNGNVPQQTLQRKHQFKDDLTWSRGSHAFKFGGDFTWVSKLGGLFAFLSAPEYDLNFDPSEIVNNPADFPQGFNTPGTVGAIAVAGGNPSFDLRDGAKQVAWYVQDDWKISPRLTLNLGVRYDVDLGFVDSKHQVNNRTFKALQIIGNSYGSRVVEDDKNNYSPRVGFAWDIKGNGRSVIRGGYGIYYDQSFLNVPLFAVQQANEEIYGSIVEFGDFSLATPAPVFPRPFTNPIAPITGRLIDPDFEAPFTQQANLAYEVEISKNSSLSFDYVHIIGLHEFTQLDINPRTGPLVNAQRTSATQPRLLAPAFAAHAAELIAEFGIAVPFGGIRVAQSDGRSVYDAFTVSYRKRYANKFEFRTHYTLARAKAWFGIISDFGLQPQNPFNKFDAAADYGYTGEDERHRFVMSGAFDLPLSLQLAPILQFSSARPYSILPDQSFGADINKDGVGNDRNTRDGNDQHKLPPFTERGDKFAQVNLRLTWSHKFKESMKFSAFFEGFNLFNTGNFGNQYGTTLGTTNFQKPINFFGATGFSEPIGIPFQGQFGVRFSF